MTSSADAVPAGPGVREFLAALAGGAPTPGGGAAAALCGAVAAALVAMVGRVTAAREACVASEASAIVGQADELRARLAGLVDEDMEAYASVVEAQRSGGGEALTRALARATEVPMRLAAACREVLVLAEILAPLARRTALSDLGVAGTLAWGALESGVLTARANLGRMADAKLARRHESDLAGLLAAGQDGRQRLMETTAGRESTSRPS
jgi:formiminotetrahydrofolate cyclodeaminase